MNCGWNSGGTETFGVTDDKSRCGAEVVQKKTLGTEGLKKGKRGELFVGQVENIAAGKTRVVMGAVEEE